MKFSVEFETKMTASITIEANSEEEARREAGSLGYSDLQWEEANLVGLLNIVDISEEA